MKPRVLFVEQFYYPDGWGGAELPRDLTTYLARNDFEVEVICGADQYAPVEGDVCEDPRAAGVIIRRIPKLGFGPRFLPKAARQMWFILAAAPLLFVRKRPRIIVAQTNPPMGIVLGALASMFWRTPLVIIAMDVYPEVVVAHGALSSDGWVARLLGRIFSWAYQSAERVVVLGQVMRERLVAKGVKDGRIVEISNWSTGKPGVVRGDANNMRRELNLANRFVVLYSGNIGIAHEFDTFLSGFAEACSLLPDLRLLFIGKGSRTAMVRQVIERLHLSERVAFLGYVPGCRLPESIGVADLALVTLQPGFEGLVVPSKLYGYMSRGVPVLYVGPRSDTEIAIRSAGCGMVIPTGDAQGVCDALAKFHADRVLLRKMGDAGQTAYEAGLTSAHALARYDSLFRQLLQGNGAA